MFRYFDKNLPLLLLGVVKGACKLQCPVTVWKMGLCVSLMLSWSWQKAENLKLLPSNVVKFTSVMAHSTASPPNTMCRMIDFAQILTQSDNIPRGWIQIIWTIYKKSTIVVQSLWNLVKIFIWRVLYVARISAGLDQNCEFFINSNVLGQSK